ncbi:hypothetical protein [Bradyrhizobium sp. I71]|jgi:hypothetical protein|nr:hypothetical protein [Bradyrhizobium sp. I71]
MAEPEKPKPAEEAKPSRVEEARSVIEEYANGLREIIRKLRQKLH